VCGCGCVCAVGNSFCGRDGGVEGTLDRDEREGEREWEREGAHVRVRV